MEVLKIPKKNQVQIIRKYPPHISHIFEAIKYYYLSQKPLIEDIFQQDNLNYSQAYLRQKNMLPKRKYFCLQDYINYQIKNKSRPLCAKLIEINQIVIECRDCGLCQNSIICIDCFRDGDHRGHRYVAKKANGGCCDCGDSQVWKKKGFCPNHNGEIQQINISQQAQNEFNRTWKYIFYWYFALLQQYPDISQQYGSEIINFLNKMVVNSIDYNANLTNLFQQVLDSQNFKLPDYFNNLKIIDCILLCTTSSRKIQQFTNLFLRMLSHYDFKRNLAVALIKNYSKIQIQQKTQQTFLDLNAQILTHQQLVEQILNKGYFVVDKINKKQQTLNRIFYLYHSYRYLNQLQKKNQRKYWQRHLMSEHGIISICTLFEYAQNKWKSNLFQNELLSNSFIFQLQYIQIISTIGQNLRYKKKILQKVIQDLFKHILTLNKIINPMYLSYHRALLIFIFIYFDCNLENDLELKIKKLQQITNTQNIQKITILQKLLVPIQNSLLFFLKIKNNPNLKDRFRRYWKYYYSKSRILFSIDVVALKLFTIYKNLKIVNSYVFSNSNEFKIDDDTVENIKMYIQFLGLMNQICYQKCEQLNLIKNCEWTDNQKNQKIIDKEYNRLIVQFLSIKKSCSTAQLDEFKKQFLNINYNVLDTIKSFSDFDKISKRFTIKNNYIQNDKNSFNIGYYITKINTITTMMTVQQNLELKNYQLSINRKIFLQGYMQNDSLAQFDTLLYNIKNYMLNTYVQNVYLNIMIKLYNNLLKELIKIYELSSILEMILFSQQLKLILQKHKQCKYLNGTTKKYMDKKIGKLIEETMVAQIKKSNKNNKFIEEMKKKQQKFKAYMQNLQTSINIQQTDQQECIVCKHSLKKQQQCVIPAYIQYSNRYFRRKLQNFFKSDRLYPINFSDQTYKNIVLTSCSHILHKKCIDNSKIKSCFLCRRSCNILVPQVTPNTNIKQIDQFLTRLCLTETKLNKQNKSRNFQYIILSFLQVLGNISDEAGIQFFMGKMLKHYRNILKLLRLKYSKMKQQSKQKFLDQIKQIISNYQFVKQNLLQNQQEWQTYIQTNLDWLILQSIKCYIIQNPINLQKQFLLRFSINQKYNHKLVQIICLLKFLIQEKHTHPSIKDISIKNITQQKPFPNKLFPRYFCSNQNLTFRQLPTRYAPLAKFRAQCPHCKLLQNHQVICLLCLDWSGCINCSVLPLRRHSQQQHSNNCIFMILQTTQVIYFSYPNAHISQYLYKDEYGYKFAVLGNWDNFQLDNLLYNKVKKIVNQYEIGVQIGYEQIKLNAIYNGFDF